MDQSHTALFEDVDCALCGGQDYKVLGQACYPENLDRNDLLSIYKSSSDVKLLDRLVECEHCRLVQLSPRVSQKIILESYSGAVDPKFITQDHLRIDTFTRSLKKILRHLPVKDKGALNILDVGCAGGAFPKAAHDLGLSVIGVEPSRWLCDQGKKKYGLDLRPGTLEEQNFRENSFDLITLWDVIEHLTHPEKTLSEICRLLRPGGHLVVNYPNFGSWQAKLLGKKWPFLLSVHLYYFTPKTIAELLAKFKLEVLSQRPHWQKLELGHVLERARPYFPLLGPLCGLCRFLRLDRLPIFYAIGQTQVVARLKK